MDSSYVAYLNSPLWRDIRKELLDAVDWQCEECGEKATQVHHLNYDCLGEEESDDVMCLCSDCHLLKHSEDGKDGDDEYGEF